MKPYNVYQCLAGELMTDRDVKEKGSKFWNKGKWDNFVAPFLPKDCQEQILIDMGCNAGLFLKFAEDRGFKAIGVDSDKEAVERGLKWRDKNGSKYQILKFGIENCIDTLPVADYTVLANAHYYFTVNDWLEYMDKLQYKTCYCIIVTDKKRHLNRCWASADVKDIRSFFKNWDEVGFIDLISPEGDPSPRELRSFCFKSRFIDKVPIDTLDSSNHVQDTFYGELDKGMEYKQTRYYRILKPYRKNWSEERLNNWVEERIEGYNNLKENGLKVPIIVDSKDEILDGNHRYSAMKHLGYKNIFIRKI